MRSLIPILLAVVVLSSGCDPDGYSCNSEECYADDNNPQYQTLEDCNSLCNEPKLGGCGSLVLYEDYLYSTVQIGSQCWFAENCRYLPEVSPSSAGSDASPYYYVYGYEGTDVGVAQATIHYDTYGALYNWPAVMTEGICPSGWHIPSDSEWQTMEVSLGMSESEASSTSFRGSPVGDYMKSTSGWNNDGNGSNSSSFNGIPGGFRGDWSNTFEGLGNYGYWWSSSEDNIQDSWYRFLLNQTDDGYRGSYVNSGGFSARCVRD